VPQRWILERHVLVNPFVLELQYRNRKEHLFLSLYKILNIDYEMTALCCSLRCLRKSLKMHAEELSLLGYTAV
jgi:hypothetical protein